MYQLLTIKEFERFHKKKIKPKDKIVNKSKILIT